MDKIKVGLQYWIPQHGLTRLVGKLASAKAGGLTTAIINWFIKQYKVNMDEALHSDPKHFKTFNEFFVRELKEGMRPITEDESVIVHPADARVSQFGPITDGQLIQAKTITTQLANYWAVIQAWRMSSKTANSQRFTYRQVITTVFTCHATAHCAR